MTTTRKTITLTKQQDNWVKAQIANGDYTNDSEYFRDLIRRDQEQRSRFNTLKTSIMDGLNSGISQRTVGDIWAEAEAKHNARS